MNNLRKLNDKQLAFLHMNIYCCVKKGKIQQERLRRINNELVIDNLAKNKNNKRR